MTKQTINILEHLRVTALKKRITQTQIAEKLGFTKATINNYFNYHSEPDLTTFCQICEILDVKFTIEGM
jgi:transcriptional regulator with XRE-family HTH domain